MRSESGAYKNPLDGLSLFPEGAPSSLRDKAVKELSIIANNAMEIWPTSSGVLYGSLYFGEGKWREIDGNITMLSDYDLYIVLDNLIDYLKALKDKDRLAKVITKGVSGSVSITFSWGTLIKLKLVSMLGEIIWGNTDLKTYIVKTKPPPLVNALKLGYLFLIRAIADEDKRRSLLESAVVHCFWSYLLSTGRFKHNWSEIFSLKRDLEVLENERFLGSDVRSIVGKTLESRLNSGNIKQGYKNRDLFYAAKFLVNCAYNKGSIRFRLKDYIHYIYYKFNKRSFDKMLINITRRRLDLYKTVVDITNVDFTVSDISRLRAVVYEAESILSVEHKGYLLNSEELVKYCSDLMIALEGMYIHKARL